MKTDSVSLRILVPDETTNYIQNPSARYDTAGWNVLNSTLTRTLDYARFGISSFKVITNGSTLKEGVNYRVNNLFGIQDVITISAYVRGTGKIRIRLEDNSGGMEWSSKPIVLSQVRWQRIEVFGRCSGGNDIRLWVETFGNSAQVITFYVDGAQMERHPYSTSYCDGDQVGCRWNIIQHASLSTRPATTRQGGKWVSLSGKDREEEDLYMTVVGGLGMPSLVNNIQPFALSAGSYFQNTKITERIVTLAFHAKNTDLLGKEKPVSLVHLHALRQYLIDIVKPDLTAGSQEFLMEYIDGDIPLYFRARYDGGLEGEWDVRNKWVNSFPLRLLIVSPMIQEDSQEIKNLDFQEAFFAQNVAGRVDGRWSNLNFGFNLQSDKVAMGRKGEIYACGSFTYANNNINAISPNVPANRVAMWDGTKWNILGSGANGRVLDISIAPNGYVYAVGAFTTIGGVAANRIAYWDGAAWNAMGTGLNADGYGIAFAPNGDIYAVGDFTSAGGSNSRYISRWNGSIWNVVGSLSGLNATATTISISPDGLFLYVGGSFTDQFGVATNALLGVAKYTPSTNTFSGVGSGLNSTVYKVLIASSGIVYASGNFTASGTTVVNRIAQLMGSAWAPLGSGMNGIVYSMDVSINGDLVACGVFSTAGGISAKTIALWNGSSWVNLDVEFDIGLAYGSMAIFDAQFTPSGDLYVCGGLNASPPVYQSQVSGITTITNIGTSVASPFIYISGQGTLRWIENQSIGKRMFFNLIVLNGEEVFIDFGKGTIESTVRGSLLYSIIPGSDFSDFVLKPGDNKIAMFINQDVGAVAKIGYVPTHWSMDYSR